MFRQKKRTVVCLLSVRPVCTISTKHRYKEKNCKYDMGKRVYCLSLSSIPVFARFYPNVCVSVYGFRHKSVCETPVRTVLVVRGIDA